MCVEVYITFDVENGGVVSGSIVKSDGLDITKLIELICITLEEVLVISKVSVLPYSVGEISVNVITSIKVIEPGSLLTKLDGSANIVGFSSEEGLITKSEAVGTESNLVELEDK